MSDWHFFHCTAWRYKFQSVVWLYGFSDATLPLRVLIGPPLRARTSFKVQPSAILQKNRRETQNSKLNHWLKTVIDSNWLVEREVGH